MILINLLRIHSQSLDDVAIADATVDVSDFNAAVTQANTATGQTTRANNATLFTLSNATAFNGGTASDFATLLTSETNGLISGGITTQALTVDSGTIAVSAANDLNTTTTGVVTATITEGDMSTLASLADKEGGQSTDNAYTVTITDTSVAASALNTLAGKTSVAVTGSAITTLTGTISDVNTAYANTSGITGLGNEAVTISDTTNSGNGVAIAELNTLDDNTTGTIDAGTITVATGTLAKLLKAYGSNGITGLGNETITVSDTGSLAASDLNSLDSKTSGSVTTSNSLATLTGSVSALNTAYGSGGLTIQGDEAITITGSAVTVAAADLNLLNSYTSGSIDADNVAKLTGSVADLNTAFAAKAASGSNGIDFGGSSGAADQAVEITDATVLAVDLNTLNSNTTGHRCKYIICNRRNSSGCEPYL